MVFRNPHALTVPLFGGFVYAKNPLVRGGEQILNQFQHRVFSLIRGGSTVVALAAEIECVPEKVRLAVGALEQTGLVLVSDAPSFPRPEAPEAGHALTLWVHTSNRCNLACPYCYVNAEKRGPRMTPKTLRRLRAKVVSAADRGDVEVVTLKLAGGEPLLTFLDWKDEVAGAKRDLEERGVEVHLHLLTNGTIFNDAIISYIAEYGIGVGLSVDGLGATHDATRSFHGGRGSFSLVQKNLGRLRGAEVDPYVTTVVSWRNIHELLPLTEFFIGENIGFRYSLEKGGSLDREAIADALAPCYEAVETAIPTYDRFLSHTLCDLSFARPVVDTACGVGRSHASVDVGGSLHACQTEHDREAIGGIYEERNLVDMIANSEVGQTLAAISESCEVCPYRYLCAGGCPTFKENRKSPYCGTFHDLIPTILRLRGLTILYRLKERETMRQ